MSLRLSSQFKKTIATFFECKVCHKLLLWKEWPHGYVIMTPQNARQCPHKDPVVSGTANISSSEELICLFVLIPREEEEERKKERKKERIEKKRGYSRT